MGGKLCAAATPAERKDSLTREAVFLLQLVQQKKYFESSTHRRLIHEDQCAGVERVIPDTNGAGVPKGEALLLLRLQTVGARNHELSAVDV